MKTALIGHSGFVGQTLDGALKPTHRYRSTNIESIVGESFDHVVCAGVQAVKWWANQNPEEDWNGIQRLLRPLSRVSADRVTLISTIDVYNPPVAVDEDSIIDPAGHHPYGAHRLRVEEEIRKMFPRVLVLRLPGLFGRGLKKNVIFDLMHDNNLERVHPEGSFQYYDTSRLAEDMGKAWGLGLKLLNVSAEPILTRKIRDRFFPGKQLAGEIERREAGAAPAGYDMLSKHAGVWGGDDGYLYSSATVLDDLEGWLQDELG